MALADRSDPWLTIVMPVHRPGEWLNAALASIPSPPRDCSLAIVIRDSTPEGSCEKLIEPHRKRLAIDYAHWPETPSWPRKTNLGVEAARSELVCTLHQDDLWLPERLKVIAAMCAAHPHAALYVTAAAIVDPKGLRIGLWNPPFQPALQDIRDFTNRLLIQNSIAMPSPVWRRDAYLACGGLDESLWYTPDWDLWLKLARQGDVVFDPQATAAFRIHGSSLTMTGDRTQMKRELDAILARHGHADGQHGALCRASAKVNAALADAASGDLVAGLSAIAAIVRLGPAGAAKYLRYSRLFERVWPRLRLRLKGAM